jgi:hypothetical protein
MTGAALRALRALPCVGRDLPVSHPIGPTALGECACWEFAGFGAFRAISPVEPLRSGLASGLSESVRDRGVIVEDDPIGPKRVAESSGRALRD